MNTNGLDYKKEKRSYKNIFYIIISLFCWFMTLILFSLSINFFECLRKNFDFFFFLLSMIFLFLGLYFEYLLLSENKDKDKNKEKSIIIKELAQEQIKNSQKVFNALDVLSKKDKEKESKLNITKNNE